MIAAATAGGKTEAAFLPLISNLLSQPDRTRGFKLLYVSPLKALINDQFRRLDELCEAMEIPVHRWHGDVAVTKKAKARKDPDGILLITPESLEALFVRRGLELPRLFRPLQAVVIDELHAFLGEERGVQLSSLLARLELLVDRHPRRIGLSATLGDMSLACSYLRRDAAEKVATVVASGDGGALKLLLKGYCRSPIAPKLVPAEIEEGKQAAAKEAVGGCDRDISQHLFSRLRGTSNLVFAGSRQNVELISDQLRTLSEREGCPNEFFPHHGNLSRAHREDLEQRLKDGRRPTTAVCTSTLELGIDIGEVESVAQIGPPRSVASLRQRLGRSGRREGRPAVLRVYVTENAIDERSHPCTKLRLGLVQAIAVIDLLLEGWCESPGGHALHFSTLVHQLLSVIAQRGGMAARDLYFTLCRHGSFSTVTPQLFQQLLRELGLPETALIEQSPDGLLLLGPEGERLVEHYSFYAVFKTLEEFRVEADGKLLGTLPVENLLTKGMAIIFAGRRWKVLEIREREKVITVTADASGIPPRFGGDLGDLHDRVAERMHRILMSDSMPTYLDEMATELLEEGRSWFLQLGLDEARRLATDDGGALLFPWRGSAAVQTLALALSAEGVEASVSQVSSLAVECDNRIEDVQATLRRLARTPAPNGVWLASLAGNLESEKFHPFLSRELLAEDAASSKLVAAQVPQLAELVSV